GMGIVVRFGSGEKDRPQAAIEHQRLVHVAVGTLPVVLDFLKLPCCFQKSLRFDFPRRCRRLRSASIGLSGMRHPEPRDYAKDATRLPTFCTWLRLKYG